MMWKKKLHNSSTQISTIICRTVTSTRFTSSISSSTPCSYSIFNSRSRFSFPSSCTIGKVKGNHFPSGLIFPGGILTRDVANLYLRNDNCFCSLSKSTEHCRCWNCGAEAEHTTPFLFCQACRSVQSIDNSIDYFQIFGLDRKYKVEVQELEKKYKDWQKKLHPDLVHSKTPREREYAAEQSVRVIDAYRTLTDPLSRAVYLMKLEGVPVDEEERITDPELLAEVMEIREAVEEAEGTEALKLIQVQLQDKLLFWSKSFEDACLRQNYEHALTSIRRMTYYKRANEEIVKKL